MAITLRQGPEYLIFVFAMGIYLVDLKTEATTLHIIAPSAPSQIKERKVNSRSYFNNLRSTAIYTL